MSDKQQQQQSHGSSGLLPQEAPVVIAEKHKLFFSFQSPGGGGRVSPMARMGWQKSQRAYVPLHCIYPEGGPLPCTLLLVQRKYPVMMHELLPSGVPITRSQQAYQTAQNQFEIQAANVRPLNTLTFQIVQYCTCTVWGVESVVTHHSSQLFCVSGPEKRKEYIFQVRLLISQVLYWGAQPVGLTGLHKAG